jgi:hypothetical protein
VHPVTPAGVLAGRGDELALLYGLVRAFTSGSGTRVIIEQDLA